MAIAERELTTLTPAELDTLWVPLMVETSTARQQLDSTRKGAAQEAAGNLRYLGYGRRLEAAEERFAAGHAAEAPFLAEWDRRGRWNRYYRCMTDGGHVHFMGCHTLTPGKSVVALLPELSGLTEAELVEAIGYAACTHCFPSAPTSSTWIKGQQEAAAAEAAKLDARCPGSGEYAANANLRLYMPRGTCPSCGQWVSVTRPAGKIRAHKRTAA